MATYKETAKNGGVLYTVSEVPPAPVGVFLGFQHYLTMLGATALIPLIVVGPMGGSLTDTAEVICTIFFVAGLNTLIQSVFGDRLPIVQGGSFAFLAPTFGIIGLVAGDLCPEPGSGIEAPADCVAPEDQFRTTMCTIQGAVFVVGLVQCALGYSGALILFVKYISPLVIAPTVMMVSLGLYGVPAGNMSGCELWTGIVVVCMIVFSQLLKKVIINVKGVPFPIFELFPIIWTVVVAWAIMLIVQSAGGMEPLMNAYGNVTLEKKWSICKTSGAVIDASLWIKLPLPFQWGMPIFRGAAIGPMVGAMFVSMVESIGDYFACAQLAGAPPPSAAIVSRGLAGEGWGLVMCGLFGTSNGTTSYGENIGALGITKVGSRAVVQTGAVCMMIAGLFPKFGAIFAAMPGSMVAGLYICLFGMIASCGLSQLQHVDLNSTRNLFILGFCAYNGLAISGAGGYFNSQPANPFGPDDTFWMTFFNNPMVISGLAGVLLDNIIPGTPEERGLKAYQANNSPKAWLDPEFVEVYAYMWPLNKIFSNCVYLDFLSNGFKWPEKPESEAFPASSADCCNMLCGCLYKKGADTEVKMADA